MYCICCIFCFLVKKVDNKLLAMMQGLAGEIKVAASFWLLLAPALE
ncbi:hypothetical protein ACQV2X_01645 [Facklamia sp. P12945]